MTLSRRKLLGTAAAAAALSQAAKAARPARPVAISSSNGLHAVERAVRGMSSGEDPLDAAIAGVNIVEDDPNDMTVGYGGIPNDEGVVQLDACVKNPTRVAKLVMETTDHVLLVGPGARRFATMNGFPVENLLTEKARKVWLFWRQNLSANDKWLEPDPEHYPPEVREFIEKYGWDDLRKPSSGGTIHLSAVDARGDLAGCTSTSGLFFKMPGRVGDSPIIGAGCFTDNEVGSAGSTGRGEANLLVSGGHLTVEFMRQGKHPRDACLMTLERIAKTTREKRLRDARGRPNFDIAFYAVNKDGQYGCAVTYGTSSTGKRRQFCVADPSGARKEDCAYLYERR